MKAYVGRAGVRWVNAAGSRVCRLEWRLAQTSGYRQRYAICHAMAARGRIQGAHMYSSGQRRFAATVHQTSKVHVREGRPGVQSLVESQTHAIP